MNLNLLSRDLGAAVVDCSDEFFGTADTLLLSAEPHRPGTYGLRGADVDGWESRRHNPADHDWIVFRMAHPGRIDELVLETTGFRFNAPRRISVDIAEAPDADWREILADAEVQANSINVYPLSDPSPVGSLLRLRIFPDGGIARFRAHGVVDADRSRPPAGIRLSDIRRGCRATASEGSFGNPWAVMSHSMPANTHDGWETPRRTDADLHHVDQSWPEAVTLTSLEVVATVFRGNCAKSVSIETTCDGRSWNRIGEFDVTAGATTRIDFEPVVARTARVRVLPDGGVARLWFYGTQQTNPHHTHQEER